MSDQIIEQLLRDPAEPPSAELVNAAIGKRLYAVYVRTITLFDELGLSSEWRYYADSKAWLCKITLKNKTVLWMSIWTKCIKTSFYFTEKTHTGILDLKIDQNVKDVFLSTARIGRLMPLVLDITSRKEIDDLKAIILYKTSLK